MRGHQHQLVFTATVSGALSSVISLNGTFVDVEACPEGETPAAGGISCECDFGYEQRGVGTTLTCQPCDSSTFKPFTGPDACVPCPLHTNAPKPGAVRMQDCLCSTGYYYSNTTKECEECVTGAVCPFGSDLETMIVQPGYYRFSPTSEMFYECASTDACVGDVTYSSDMHTGCGVGYEGALCSTCSVGYGGDSCLRTLHLVGICDTNDACQRV